MLISFPTAAVIVSSSTEYATTWFAQFLPLLYVVVGVAVAVGAIMFIRRKVGGGVSRALGSRGRGRRRR